MGIEFRRKIIDDNNMILRPATLLALIKSKQIPTSSILQGMNLLCISLLSADNALIDYIMDTPHLNFNEPCIAGKTPLHLALELKLAKYIVQDLVLRNADPCLVNDQHQTSLIVAFKTLHPARQQVLDRSQKCINIPDKYGCTPLWWLVRSLTDKKIRNPSCKALSRQIGQLKESADVGDMRNKNTPLHLVLLKKGFLPKSIRRLLISMTDLDLPNRGGLTARQLLERSSLKKTQIKNLD
jgi:hypothetical protein